VLLYQKKEKKSKESLKKISIHEKEKRSSPSLRARSTFHCPDIFYRNLQRACPVLNFHGFHLLRQMEASPLYFTQGTPFTIHPVHCLNEPNDLLYEERGTN
jgi:hypothetical protein